jgi:hypothetical protein
LWPDPSGVLYQSRLAWPKYGMKKKTDEDFWPSWAIFNAIGAALLSCGVAYIFINQPINTPIGYIILIGILVIGGVTIWGFYRSGEKSNVKGLDEPGHMK